MDPGHNQIERLLLTDGRRLHALIYRVTLSLDAADDLLQELCVRLMRARLDAVEQLAGYATRVAVNLAMDWRRTRRESDGKIAEPPDTQLGPPQMAERRESLEKTLDAVRDLREPLREIVVLRYIEGESYEFIATTLGKTPHQIRGLAHKAIRSLREALAGREPHMSQGVSHARDL